MYSSRLGPTPPPPFPNQHFLISMLSPLPQKTENFNMMFVFTETHLLIIQMVIKTSLANLTVIALNINIGSPTSKRTKKQKTTVKPPNEQQQQNRFFYKNLPPQLKFVLKAPNSHPPKFLPQIPSTDVVLGYSLFKQHAKGISGNDLRHLQKPPQCDRHCRSNLLLHSITVYRHWKLLPQSASLA